MGRRRDGSLNDEGVIRREAVITVAPDGIPGIFLEESKNRVVFVKSLCVILYKLENKPLPVSKLPL